MRAAEPGSRGRIAGRKGAEAPAAEAAEQRTLRNARQRRYLERKAMCQAVGRFLITENLVTALIAAGFISDSEAATNLGIEEGVAAVLSKFANDTNR